MSGWGAAFAKAVEIEAEGTKDFADIIEIDEARSRKRKLSDITDPINTDEDADEAGGIVNGGGFSQPRKLAVFICTALSAAPVGSTTSPITGTMTIDPTATSVPLGTKAATSVPLGTKVTPDARDVSSPFQPLDSSNIPRQICRAWLKHKYLSLGQACTKPVCGRKHYIEVGPNLKQLYADYSFKGLNTAHQKRILEAVMLERQAHQEEVPSPIHCPVVHSAGLQQITRKECEKATVAIQHSMKSTAEQQPEQGDQHKEKQQQQQQPERMSRTLHNRKHRKERHENKMAKKMMPALKPSTDDAKSCATTTTTTAAAANANVNSAVTEQKKHQHKSKKK